jgi:hypothetical protein
VSWEVTSENKYWKYFLVSGDKISIPALMHVLTRAAAAVCEL